MRKHEYESHEVTCRLVTSKSKVAPLTPMTVPKLELMGAVLGLRLAQSVIVVLGIPMQDVLFYSDSIDVLWWICRRGKEFRPFVANRVGEIQSNSKPSQWQHVSTHENPADLCTRGTSPSQLAENVLWWEGPAWIKKEEDQWPRMKSDNRPDELPERRTTQSEGGGVVLAVNTQRDEGTSQPKGDKTWRLDPQRFSDWLWYIRVFAHVKRALHNMCNADQRKAERELTIDEIKEVEQDVMRLAQQDGFREDYELVKRSKPLPSSSPLIKLNPRIDESGVIRSDGRLEFAEQLPYEVRHPVILPRGHWVTKLIVKHYHERGNHNAGVNFILSQINEKYWIITAREEIRDWEKECNFCKRRRSRPANQIMAPLPKVRLRFTYRAFDQCGVDYAGPFTTIQGRRRRQQKRWLCVFTCLSVRAVHLEMAWAMDTDAFLNAFSRFTSRRGLPKEVVSDNGTNFVGPVNELKELKEVFNQLDQEKIKRKTSAQRVKWLFNPPAGPHFGGVHEILVKAAKKAMYAVLSNGVVNNEELITIFTEVEGLLNSRPLTYQSADVRDIVPLTPNHFLLGQMGRQFAPEHDVCEGFRPRQRWRKVQHLVSMVWQRWLKEYLPMLTARPKWYDVEKNLKIGDVILLVQPGLSRENWPLGRIVDVSLGKTDIQE